MDRRKVKKREALAILPDALSSDPKAIWWDLGTAVPENERDGAVAVVHVRGSLEHHPGYAGDSYDGILERARCAFAGDDEEPPVAVVLRIDSPGGVCSGLNQTVLALRKLSEDTGIPLYAYVDELAASAAYALACACAAGIAMPPSAIAGSIGVISTMFDQVAADEAMGLNFVTITSGARKADGHPHVPVSDAAVAAERSRVDRLAKQFYNLVADVRPISAAEASELQAGIFLAGEAKAKGLADAVMGWDEFIATITDESSTLAKKVQSAIGVSYNAPKAHHGGDMLLALKNQIKRAQAALDAEKDPKARAAIASRIATYQAAVEAFKKEKYVKETVEKHSSEESEEEEAEEAAESEESEEEAKMSKSEEEEAESKGNETERKQGDDDGDDDDGGDGEDEAEAKKAAKAALAGGATGRKALGKLAAVFAKAQKFDSLNARVAKIEASARKAEKNALIDEAVAQRRITRSMATTLRGKSVDFVKGTLEMHKSAMVHIDEESLAIPDGRPNADLPANVLKSIETAVNAAALPTKEAQEKFRSELITAQRERLASANGAGRY